MQMIKLSVKQEEIVNHIEGSILVKAGPGSGKTRVLIERIKHLLKSNRRIKILALTFSNLAADEIRSRLQEDVSIGELVENVTVGTIHSFCLELLQTRGNLIGIKENMVIFDNMADQQAVLRDVFTSDPNLLQILKKNTHPITSFLQQCLSLIADQKKKFISPTMCERMEPYPTIYREYNQLLLKQNALDFDDILFFAYRILTENPSVVNLYNSLYKFICVDEAQDLNFAQYEVLKAMCGNTFKNIMLVGDENQSIYGFNGSDSSLMSKNFVNDFSPTVYNLNENYRSAKAIVRFANQLENYESVTNYVYEGELEVFQCKNEIHEASFVVHKLKEILEKKHPDIQDPLSFASFGIIGRNKYVLSEVEKAFKKQGIPYYYKKASSIEMESDYLKVFDLGLRTILNPKDIVHLKELCQIIGSRANDISPTLTGFEILQQLLQNTLYTPLLQAFSLLGNENLDFSKVLCLVKEDIPASLEDEERYFIIKDIQQFASHWKKYTSQVPRENRTLLSFRNYMSLGKTQDTSSNKGVSLLSAHMSKGLQYEVVFVVGLTEGTFPDYRAIRTGGAQLEQEKNNMYVAVTRAKRLCYLSYPQVKKMPWGDWKSQSPSRYLKTSKIIILNEDT